MLDLPRVGDASGFDRGVGQERFEQKYVCGFVVDDQDAGAHCSSRISRICLPKVLVSMGLAIYPRQPAAIVCSRSPVIASAVSAITGMFLVVGSALSSRVSESPSRPGSWTSIRMRLGSLSTNFSLASSAAPATSTRYPSRSRTERARSLLGSLSSMGITNGLYLTDLRRLATPASA